MPSLRVLMYAIVNARLLSCHFSILSTLLSTSLAFHHLRASPWLEWFVLATLKRSCIVQQPDLTLVSSISHMERSLEIIESSSYNPMINRSKILMLIFAKCRFQQAIKAGQECMVLLLSPCKTKIISLFAFVSIFLYNPRCIHSRLSLLCGTGF